MLLSRFCWSALAFAFLCLVAAPAGGYAPVPRPAGPRGEPEVQVVGVYEGTYPTGVRHRAGFHPQGAVTVKVGDVKKPVILVLTSYEPVVWKVDAPKKAVARVILSGYHDQAVAGIDKKVPVTRLTYKGGSKGYFYAYRKAADPKESAYEKQQAADSYARLVKRVKELTGKEVTGFRGRYAGETFELP